MGTNNLIIDIISMQTAFVVKPRVALQARVPSKAHARRAMVASAPKPEQIDAAVKEAEEACSGGDQGECAAAWDTVEELSAAASHAKASGPEDPLEKFCEEDPSADECRVYED